MIAFEIIDGIEDIEVSNALVVSPNPCSDKLNINTSLFEKGTVQIINTFGQTIMEKKELDLNNPIDVYHLKSGIYYVLLQNDKQMMSTRFIKK